MQLSVVIPTWNTAAMTLECCRAVLEQLPADSEVIVVDDGSSDGTAQQIADAFPSIIVVRRVENGGFTAAANDGVSRATGGLLFMLNSDAVVLPGAIAALLSAFASNAQLGVAGARLLNVDGAPQWSGGRRPTLAWLIGVVSGAGRFARFFRRRGGAPPAGDVDWVSGAAMMFRASVWRDAGPFDARFRFYCQDLELCAKVRDLGWRVRVIEDARVVHALGASVDRGGELHHDPERLWCDLFDWAARRYGERWARFARPILVAAAWSRVVVRTVVSPRRAEAASLGRAARALSGRPLKSL